MPAALILALAILQTPARPNAQIISDLRQNAKDGRFETILPLMQKLGPLDESETESINGLVNGTLIGQLEPKDRPLMLRVVRAALEKAPFSDPKSVPHWQTKSTEARILEVLDRHEEAIATLDATMAETSDLGRDILTGLRNHLALVGNPAPPVAFTRSFGKFPGLSKWRGKVVVVDFFAHWCGPCIAEFPELKAIYQDHHREGLELLGSTEFFGYFGAQKNLAPDAEFTAMRGFVKEKALPWPVVFTTPEVKKTYRQLALPNVVVIDRHGIVREVGYGFYPGEPGKLRTLVERLLTEK